MSVREFHDFPSGSRITIDRRKVISIGTWGFRSGLLLVRMIDEAGRSREDVIEATELSFMDWLGRDVPIDFLGRGSLTPNMPVDAPHSIQ